MATSVAVVGPTAISVTGLTETVIGTWTAPSAAKSLKGVRVHFWCQTVNDASLTKVPRLTITSDDLSPGIAPCLILAEPTSGSPVTSDASQGQRQNVYYPLNYPVKGGQVVSFSGCIYVTTTTAPMMGVDVIFGTDAPASPRYHYQVIAATFATTVTAAAQHLNPTTYRITGAKAITEAYGVVWQTTGVAIGCIGRFALTSSDFKTPFGIEWLVDGNSAVISVGGMNLHVSHAGSPEAPINIPVNDVCNIQENFTNGPTNIVGAYVTGVQYI